MCQSVINRLASSREEISKRDTRSDAAKMEVNSLWICLLNQIFKILLPLHSTRRENFPYLSLSVTSFHHTCF